MKKGVLILIGMFLIVTTIKAENNKEIPNTIGFNYSYNNSVNFEERGVEFFIFTNGEFDFNTHYNSYENQRGIQITRDYRGRIERIGNSFINYDSYGNVTRIGNVFMRYYRGKLTDVGNLKVKYDHWGTPRFYGNVKDNYYNGVRFNLSIGDIFDYNNSYFYHRDFSRNYSRIREDNHYFYYRANTNAKIGNRSQILRRRKPASSISNKRPNTITRRSNTTYRKPSTIDARRSTNTTTRRPSTVNTKKSIDRRSSTSTSKRPTNVTRGNTASEKRNSTSTSRKPTTVKRSTKNTERTASSRRN
ncbi:hypothetical protein [Polaribacter sp. Q13]|uniref:hypothetical protein n=1 Tax=Polaribacter sp. Q13 TaxID=2806551 RepID=UPI00193B5235|nr:hypothetical protein [Polaribacter sp. Q13]QVY65656.1 hypothetical protein JOP69_18295 [Polaribacter sp. Q13]